MLFFRSHHEDRLEPDLDPVLCDSRAQAPSQRAAASQKQMQEERLRKEVTEGDS